MKFNVNMRFNVKLSQKLDDGDTALVEEHRDLNETEVSHVIGSYQLKAMSKSYVDSFTVIVEIKR